MSNVVLPENSRNVSNQIANRSIKTGFVFITLFGLLFFGVGAFIAVKTWRQVQVSSLASGTVVNLIPVQDSKGGVTYKREVRFSLPGGKVVTGREDMSSKPTSPVGAQVQVYYRNDSPENIIVNSFVSLYLFPLIFCSIGLAPLLIALILKNIQRKQKQKLIRLQNEGMAVAATVTEVFEDTRTSINGQHPYYVSAEGIDPVTNQARQFRSRRIWIQGLPDIVKVNDVVQVYVSRVDAQEYVVDVEQLVNKAV